MSYPQAPRTDLVETVHGLQIADPYRGLEDPTDAATQAWSTAQDTLYLDQAATWPGRDGAAARIRELLGAGMVGVPVWRGERCFFMRREGSQEHAVLMVSEPSTADHMQGQGQDRAADGRRERVLLDPIALDPTGLTTLDSWQPSKEGDLLAYQVSAGGTEESILTVVEVATGERVDGPIDRARYSPVAFLPAAGGSRSRGYYYVRRLDPATLPLDEQQYHRRVWFHELGTDPATDLEIFGAGMDPRSYYGVAVSRQGRWLTVSAATGTAPRNDVWIADLSAPGATLGAPLLREVAVGLDARVGVSVGRDGRLYVATDLGAPRGRLAVTDPQDPGPATWQDLLPQDDEAVLEDFAVLDGDQLPRPQLVVCWTRHAVSEVSVHDLATGEPTGAAVPLPGLGSVGGLVERPEGGPELWFSYTDHLRPPHVYRYDARDGSVQLHAGPPGVVQVPDVLTRQVPYLSADGTTVRMFVISRADADPGVTRPTILYGYGGFGLSMTPGYSASILAWVEAGGVYAVANLRGGSEEGEQWHRDGMLANKQNVFDDFHAAAEKLIADGVSTPSQLCISGGSNGGLLVGAALTQRPELYQAVVCSAPLLDMVRYEQFGLGATWNVEYGSAQVAQELAWLLAYSPYHQVREGVDYPAVLFTTFDGDTRVDPLHARKLCAALQHATSGERPILLRLERDVGHGARALSRSVELSSDTMAFAAHWTGLKLP